MTKTLHERYLDYLSSEIGAKKALEDQRDLCEIMHATEFIPMFNAGNDDNREADGLEVRVQWMEPQNASGLQGPVSFLEMLVGLTRRANWLHDELSPQEWGHELLGNLELDQMWDPLSQRKRQKCIDTLERVIWRTYRQDGVGGMFPLKYPDKNQRKVEIWFQLNAYIMEKYPLDF